MGVIPPWADLPQELLSAIAECLRPNPVDTLSFRSVCKSWYSSSISLPKLFHPLPLITPSPPYPLRNPYHYLFCGKFPHSILSVTVVYAIHPPLTQDFPSSVPRAFLLSVDQSNPQKSKDLHIGVWHLEDAAHLGVIGSYPDYANVLWPPPAWIWSNDCTERVGTLLSALGRLQVKIPDFKKLEDMLDWLSLRQQRFAVKIMKLGIKMKETLSYAKCIDQILEQIKIFAVTWQRWLHCCKAVDLHNQEGTSTLGTEESHVSVSPFKILHSTSKSALLSMETKLHPAILHLEEYTSIMEGLVNSYKFSAFVDDLMGASHGAVE